MIICPRCKETRAVPPEYPCCNPACEGHWGTGCYHCHHPDYWQGKATVGGISAILQRRAIDARILGIEHGEIPF